MKTLTVAEAVRTFSALVSGMESDQEEVVITRNRKPVARLIPEPPEQDALQVFGDLFGTIDDATADSLTAAVKAGRNLKSGTLKELRNPWAF